MSDPKTALIDGDILVYQIASRVEQEVCWDPPPHGPGDTWSLWADAGQAFEQCLGALDAIAQATGVTEITMTFSHKESYRKTLEPSYKANRAGRRKPLVFRELLGRFRDSGIPVEIWPTLEADDVMGILATRMGHEAVVVTIDKDLKTIPGLHFNHKKTSEGITEVTPEEAERFFLTQCIAGDPTDGIPGVPGMGMKIAKKHLETHGFNWNSVVSAYEKKKLNEEEAMRTARLVRILTDDLWDEEAQEVVLWEPEMEVTYR